MKSKNKLFQLPPYSQKKEEKRSLYNQILNELTIHHYSNCKSYKNVLDILEFDPKKNEDAKNIPFIPVRLFKDHELLSVPRSSIMKTMKSSGTSGQKTSKIFFQFSALLCISSKTTFSGLKALVTKMSPDIFF